VMVTSPLVVIFKVYDSSTPPAVGFMMFVGSEAVCCSVMELTYVELLVRDGSKFDMRGWNFHG